MSLIHDPRTTEEHLLGSIIDGPLDVDKIDYLRRDSLHCGVRFGSAIDLERIFSCLYISERKDSICLTNKGVFALTGILSARNSLYINVYWHKTVRCCMAMLKYAVHRIANFESGRGSEAICDAILHSDQQFLQRLINFCEKYPSLEDAKGILQQFCGLAPPKLFKPAFTLHSGLKWLENSAKSIVNELLTKKHSYHVEFSEALSDILKKKLKIHVASISALVEVIPEKSGQEKWVLKECKIYNARFLEYEDLPKSVEILNEELSNSRQVYIFVHPLLYEQTRALRPTELSKVLIEARQVALSRQLKAWI